MNLIFFTSIVIHKIDSELLKKFIHSVNIAAEAGHNCTLAVSQRKQHKAILASEMLNEKVKLIHLSPGKYLPRDGKDVVFHADELFKDFTEDHYDKIIYWSAFCGHIRIMKKKDTALLTDGRVYVGFDQTWHQMQQHIVPLALKDKFHCQVLHFVNDFNEGFISDKYDDFKSYAYYNTSDGRPSYEIFDTWHNVSDACEKTKDFVFAFTTIIKKRMWISEYVNNNIQQNEKFSLYEVNYVTKVDTGIEQNKYYEELDKTKFTLVAPATDAKRFSWFRFTEALAHRCIPLLLTNSNYEDAVDFYNSDLLDVYKKYNLFIDKDVSININKFVESLDYSKIWKDIEQTSFMKTVFSKEEKTKKYLSILEGN